MATPNQTNPNAIPNMSLDEGEKSPVPPLLTPPAPPAPIAEPRSTYQAIAPLPPIEIAPDVPITLSHTWHVDDRVLAPWEPNFLYSGTIRSISIDEARGDQAQIVFDDGDEGRVFLDSLEPIAIKKHARVYCRKNMGPQHWPATVVDIEGEAVYVDFEDGSSEWTRVGALRIPCVPNGPGAEMIHFGSNRIPIGYANPDRSGGGSDGGGGIPGWVIWIGVVILINVLRIGCRSVGN